MFLCDVCVCAHTLVAMPWRCPFPIKLCKSTSIHLQASVDVAYEGEWGPEGDGAKHKREDECGEQRVAEELHALHGTAHARAIAVVEDGVDEDKDACGARAQHAAPPPAVVLARQQEVGERHGDAGAHWEQDGKDAEQDSV